MRAELIISPNEFGHIFNNASHLLSSPGRGGPLSTSLVWQQASFSSARTHADSEGDLWGSLLQDVNPIQGGATLMAVTLATGFQPGSFKDHRVGDPGGGGVRHGGRHEEKSANMMKMPFL